MASLSILVNSIPKGIHRTRCKNDNYDKKFEICRYKYQCCHCFLECTNFKDDLIEYRCLCCYKNYQQKFDEKLKEQVFNTYKFSNHNNNEFISLFQKGVYPYEYIDEWKIFNQTSSLEEEDF